MHRYIIKRLLMMIPVIIGVSFLVFFIMDLAPGDAVDLMAPEGATTEELAEIRHDLGLDKPVVLRYADYMIGMLHGDMGVSYVSKTDVFSTYVEKLPATIKLSFASILVSILLSVPYSFYIIDYIRQNRRLLELRPMKNDQLLPFLKYKRTATKQDYKQLPHRILPKSKDEVYSPSLQRIEHRTYLPLYY